MAQQFGFELSPEDLASASTQTQQQVSPTFSGLDELAPVPWWKRRLRKMYEGDGVTSTPQRSGANVGSPVENWASLGRGVNNLAMKMIGMADGGAVQGPTMAMIGEGGEPEYIVPQSKVAPWIAATMRDGVPPNPANLPRGEQRPPPPVILANTPAMGCGGKVVPAMRDGGIVAPPPWMNDGVRGTSRFPTPTPEEQFAGASAQYFMASAPPALPPSPAVEAIQSPVAQQAAAPVRPPMLGSPDAMKRLADLQRNRPLPKWYERPFMGNGAQLDMRPGVAAYSQTGRAVGNLIGSLLPINRKSNEWERNVEAAKMDATAAQAQDAATVKQQELEQRRRATDAQVAASRSTEALRNKQSAAMDAPPPRNLRVTDYTNAETGDVTRVWNDENTGDEVKREVLGGVAKPKPTATSERNPTAASLAAVAADPKATPEERAAAEKALKLLKPPKVAGAAKADPMDELLPVSEAKALNVPYGTTRRQAVGKSATAAPKLSAKEKDDLQTLSVLDNAISKLLGDQKSLKAGVGKWDGTVGSWWDRTVGTGADGKVMTARQLLGVVTGALAKAQGGASFTPTERELMERYTPVQTESDESVISKLEGLRDNFLSTKRQAIESLNNAVDDSPQPTSSGASAPIVQRNKKTGAVRHSLDGGKTWINGEPR